MKYQICNGLVKYAATVILDYINFEIRNTEKIAVVGRNGCGKTTLFKLISGLITLDNLDSDEESYIAMEGKPTIGYLQQISFEDEKLLVEEELRKVYEPVTVLQERLNELCKRMESDASEKLMKEYSDVLDQLEAMGGYSADQDMETIFTKFGFDLNDLKRPIESFSGGQKTKLAFVKLLLSKPDIMLLDEPTNHLDLPTIEWLEGYLKMYPKAVVIISHDRMFLDKVVDVTYEIEYRGMKRYPGNYSDFVLRKQQNWEKQLKDHIEQQKEIERLTALIERFKNKPTKVAMTRSKLKQIEHMVKVDAPARYNLSTFHTHFEPKVAGGMDVLQLEKLEVGYDKVLCKVTADIKRGQKLAIIGENGKGKSTLLKTIMGQLNPLGGYYKFGNQVEIGYFDQELAQYTSDKTVLDYFWDEFPDLKQTEVRTALGNFLFTKDDVFKKVEVLSGGEKVRLYLAKILKRKPNLLILDEPTNHLDIVGKETLEAMLNAYSGTILFVSHDRFFIKEIADSLLVFENDRVNYYSCGYKAYIEKLEEEKVVNEKNFSIQEEQIRGKMNVTNPSKELGKKERNIARLEKQIEECENKLVYLNQELLKPEIANEYIELLKIREQMEEEERLLEGLLEEWEMCCN